MKKHRENEFSLEHGFRLVSSYSLRNGTVIWVITEADRSSTTILLPGRILSYGCRSHVFRHGEDNDRP